jgi:hypothetical protein
MLAYPPCPAHASGDRRLTSRRRSKTRFLVAVAILVAACSPNEPTPTPNVDTSATWGPLAVIPPQDGADTARTEGRLRITDDCVFLESPGGIMLLVWPSDRTVWSPEPRTITFANFDGSIATVRDGDEAVLGGSGDSQGESGISGEDWVEGIAWVAPPSLSCSLDQRWFVGALGR